MEPQTIDAKIKAIICEQLEVEPELVTPTASFDQDLRADSLALIELVLALEESFKIEIPDEDLEGLKTVQDLVQYVTRHVAGAA